MAKPAKSKRKQSAAAPARKGGKKAVAKNEAQGKTSKAPAKPKKQEGGGLTSRMSKTQAMKSSKAAKSAKGVKGDRKAIKFLREVKVELSKVTWPTRDELVQATIVVLIAVVIAGVFIFLFDILFSRLIGLL